ncbi:MAG: PKD domain-containing protein [archaeon]
MKKRMLVLFGFILLLGVVSASFDLGNKSYSIQESYGPGDDIIGWINISFDNEPSNSMFKAFDNEISLYDLLKTNSNKNYDYECPGDCTAEYVAGNGNQTKTFDNTDVLGSNIFGLKLEGEIESISSIRFNITSTAVKDCYNQLTIDIFNDGVIDFGNNKSSGSACPSQIDKGCFNESKTMSSKTIENIEDAGYKHCQRVQLSASPGFTLGANITRNGDTRKLTMALYTLDGSEITTCQIPDGQLSCPINYLLLEPKEHYVCIYSDEDGESQIRGYEDLENGCGFNGIDVGSEDENYAFDIYAEGKEFASVGTLVVLNPKINGNSFTEEVLQYISKNYNGLNCPTNGCVIPIKINYRKPQVITLKNLDFKYRNKGGLTTESNFYDISTTPAKINSNFQKLYLDEGNFSVPTSLRNYTFNLDLESSDVISQKITVEKKPVITSLTPTETASSYPETFKVFITSSVNISEYQWDFGDSTGILKTTKNEIIHTYSETGYYNLKVTVINSNKKESSKTFEIEVNSPEEMIKIILDKKQGYLANITLQIGKFDSWDKEKVKEYFKYEGLESSLESLKTRYNKAELQSDPEAEYNSIMAELVGLQVPKSVIITRKTDSIAFPLNPKKINLDIIQEIGRGKYDSEDKDKYTDAVFTWNKENIDVKMTFREYSARFDDSTEPFLKTFEMTITNQAEESPYVIIKELENLEFAEDYSEQKESGYNYIYLKESQEKIKFSTTQDFDFNDLPVFISPSLDELEIQRDEGTGILDPESSKWIYFTLVMALLLIGGFVTYLVLQNWYKKDYESHLFKNKNSLYNLITYVQRGKSKGLNDDQIEEKLKDSGWNSEQIDYVMKKYAGKRTGMFEIPLPKVLGKITNESPKEKPKGFFPFRPRGTIPRRSQNNPQKGPVKRFFGRRPY